MVSSTNPTAYTVHAGNFLDDDGAEDGVDVFLEDIYLGEIFLVVIDSERAGRR